MKCPFSARTASLVAVLVFAIAVTCVTEDTSTADKSELSHHDKTVHADIDGQDTDTDDELVAGRSSRRHDRHRLRKHRKGAQREHRPIRMKKGVKHMKQIEDFEDYYGPGYSYMNTFHRPGMYGGRFWSYHYPTPFAHVYGSGPLGMGAYGGYGGMRRQVEWNGYGKGHHGRLGQSARKVGKRFKHEETPAAQLFGGSSYMHNRWRQNINGFGPYGYGGLRPWKHGMGRMGMMRQVFAHHPYDTKVPYPNIPYRQSYYVPPHFAYGSMGGMGMGGGMNAQAYSNILGYSGFPIQQGFKGNMWGGYPRGFRPGQMRL